jgi:hypothetical protein
MKLDCKIPDVLLYSWMTGSTLMTVAIMHNIKLNVMKKMCKPQPEFLKLVYLKI